MSNAKESFSVADPSAALNARDRSNLVNVFKNKLQDLTGKHSNVLENLSPNVRKRVEVLKEIQIQHDGLEAKFLEERAALVAKYQKLYESLYTKRFEIVNGVVDFEGATTEAAAADQQAEKGIPEFWLTAMLNNEVLVEQITEQDEEALTFLKDIKWSKSDDPKGFKLEFFFETNPYFKNTVLTKTYHLLDEDEPILERAIGTEIEWYPGKCLTQKGLQNADPITKTEQCESFFNFFSPPQVPKDEANMDKDVAEVLQNLMEKDYDVGWTIRDKIILHAVSWFTGEAGEDDYSDMDEDYFEDEEEEDDKEDTHDLIEAEEHVQEMVSSGEQPPECKQQ